MQLDAFGRAALFFKLLPQADDLLCAAVGAYPHGERRTPIAVAREPPVDDVFEEVAHAAFLDGLGHPIDGAVGGNELVLHLGDLDEPARTRIVHEGGIAPPAVRIVVLEGQRFEELAALFEHLQNDGVCLLDEKAI